MPEVRIPKELKAQFERIVDVLYDGDIDHALQSAIEGFIHHETKRLPSGEKFEHLMEKRMEVESDKEGYTEKEISAAFQKLKERKKRLESFDFGKPKKEE